VNLTADERFRVYESCAGTESTIRKNWFVLPPARAWFYRQHHPEYKALPAFRPGCGNDNYQAMQFIYPQANAHIRLPRQLDGSIGNLTFELAHNDRNATVFWHIDNEYIASTTDFHKLSVKLSTGTHTVTVVDDEGNTLFCRVEVE
jgi:penicillin-binding protein 1C